MMKTQQPEALRLAEWLDSCKLPYDPNDVSNAAAELRRLHSVNAELLEALVWAMDAGRLSYSNRIVGQNEKHCDMVDKAKAAIARAAGLNKAQE
jgi:hypothetical protein